MRIERRAKRALWFAGLVLVGSVVVSVLALTPPRPIAAPHAPAASRPGVEDPYDAGPHGAVEAFAASRTADPCGLRTSGPRGMTLLLPGCASYAAPSLVRHRGLDFVVWEQNSSEIAVAALTVRQNGDLRLSPPRLFERPRDAGGALLARTAVLDLGHSLAVSYGDRWLVLDHELQAWPGGVVTVIFLRLGASAPTVFYGGLSALGLALLLLLGRFLDPLRLRYALQRGAAVVVHLPWRGSTAVHEGRSLQLDLEGARSRGGSAQELAGSAAVVFFGARRQGQSPYRDGDAARVSELWRGDAAGALRLARARRKLAMAAICALAAGAVIALDGYVLL